MTQPDKIPAAPARRERSHLRLVTPQPEPDMGEPARLSIPFEVRDELAHRCAAALEGLALAEADGLQAVTAAAAEDAAYLLNQLIDLLATHYRTSPGPARHSAMRMVRARMVRDVPPGRCWEKVSALERRAQVVALISEGLSSEAVALRLGVTVRTVARHKRAAGLTNRVSLYEEWAPRILDHLRAFPAAAFSCSDVARVLGGSFHSRFKKTMLRLEREGHVTAVLSFRDASSPTIMVTRWRLADPAATRR